jgi:hypothetical protein
MMDANLEDLSPLIGVWQMEAQFPDSPPTGPAGTTIFEWTLDGRFLLQRAHVEIPGAPSVHALIGRSADGERFTQHYFDSRGVVRRYDMGFDGHRWELVRDAPDFTPLMFRQRFLGELSDDGRTIEGAWEMAKRDEPWSHDFALIYRRRDDPTT